MSLVLTTYYDTQPSSLRMSCPTQRTVVFNTYKMQIINNQHRTGSHMTVQYGDQTYGGHPVYRLPSCFHWQVGIISVYGATGCFHVEVVPYPKTYSITSISSLQSSSNELNAKRMVHRIRTGSANLENCF